MTRNNNIVKNVNFKLIEISEGDNNSNFIRKTLSFKPETINKINEIGKSDNNFRYPTEVISAAIDNFFNLKVK